MAIYESSDINGLGVKWDDYDDFVEDQFPGKSPYVHAGAMGVDTTVLRLFNFCLLLYSGRVYLSGLNRIEDVQSDVKRSASYLSGTSKLNEFMKEGLKFQDLIDNIFLVNTDNESNSGIGKWFFNCLHLTERNLTRNVVNRATDWLKSNEPSDGGLQLPTDIVKA
jgi:hypothetical protein